jgi:hypothetical protein
MGEKRKRRRPKFFDFSAYASAVPLAAFYTKRFDGMGAGLQLEVLMDHRQV